MPELELLLTKYDGSRHRWLTANLLGTDEFGTWLGTPAGFTVIDLDLDVIRHRPDGRVEVDDEPEFAENALRYAYPTDVVSAAAETAAGLSKALIESRPPFNGHHTRWLRQPTETP